MDAKNTNRLLRPKKTILAWDAFEREVADHIERMIGLGRSFTTSAASRVRRKPSYFSKARNGEIIFDASIEISSTGIFDEIEMLWLIECKDYASRKVTVDEIEEFHHKMMQVGAHKGSVFTRIGFESGAIEIAKTHRIGLATLNKECQINFLMSASGGAFWIDEITCKNCLMDDGETKIKNLFQLLIHELSQFKILVIPGRHNCRPATHEEFRNCLEEVPTEDLAESEQSDNA